MGLIKSLSRPKTFGFWCEAPADLHSYLGRVVMIPKYVPLKPREIIDPKGEKVVIGSITGNLTYPNFYEINGRHLISMLRFHAQMEGARDITEQQFREFELLELMVKRQPGRTQLFPGMKPRGSHG